MPKAAFVVLVRYRRYLPLLIGLTAAISFASCQIQDTQAAMFYFPQNRAWELLLGALLACAPSLHLALSERSAVRANLLSSTGILLIVIAITKLDKHSVFPGWLALLPTLGVVLIIAAGNRAWINQHILGSQPVVWIGLISYPLYLWHWPLLTFARIIEGGEPSPQIRIIALVVRAVPWYYRKPGILQWPYWLPCSTFPPNNYQAERERSLNYGAFFWLLAHLHGGLTISYLLHSIR